MGKLSQTCLEWKKQFKIFINTVPVIYLWLHGLDDKTDIATYKIIETAQSS